ncbi:HAD family hydrolase [Fischerella sp. PCC 9605]|uniref:HAD family hydrolase n=1 Tax=Fischerella sp. PCC 9605 TaxID=1173024 RepID=UPI0004B2808A|nr:HAD family hydrolase [Fischerella sp. PCC 9605]
MNKRIYLLITATFAIALICLSGLTSPTPVHATDDPLPSWNDGRVKQAITEFVSRVTTANSPDFLLREDRIATFDNDGTLWVEKPVIQGMFVLDRLKKMAAADPSLKQKQPYKAVLEEDVAYFKQAGEAAVMELLAATHANMTQEQFEQEVRTFFKTGVHPTLKVSYTRVTYKPMVELLEYLRANGFQTWICSGGGIDFMRVVSQQLYGIPPQQVIGSNGKAEFIQKDGKFAIWRLPEVGRINDKVGKPVGINLHIGKRPVFAAGNERSGGDIAMLTYSQGRPGASFQLLINHDDAQREFAYQEPDNASLNAAKVNGWNVVSIQKDWKTVFFQ